MEAEFLFGHVLHLIFFSLQAPKFSLPSCELDESRTIRAESAIQAERVGWSNKVVSVESGKEQTVVRTLATRIRNSNLKI